MILNNNNDTINIDLPDTSKKVVAPVSSSPADRVRESRERQKAIETPAEAEERRRKERERKRLSRHKLKMKKLVEEAIESADSDQPVRPRSPPKPRNIGVKIAIPTGNDKFTFKTYSVSPRIAIPNQQQREQYPTTRFIESQQRSKVRNRERQRRFRARRREKQLEMASSQVDSSDGTSRDDMNSMNSITEDDDELLQCIEMMPNEEYLDFEELEELEEIQEIDWIHTNDVHCSSCEVSYSKNKSYENWNVKSTVVLFINPGK